MNEEWLMGLSRVYGHYCHNVSPIYRWIKHPIAISPASRNHSAPGCISSSTAQRILRPWWGNEGKSGLIQRECANLNRSISIYIYRLSTMSWDQPTRSLASSHRRNSMSDLWHLWIKLEAQSGQSHEIPKSPLDCCLYRSPFPIFLHYRSTLNPMKNPEDKDPMKAPDL